MSGSLGDGSIPCGASTTGDDKYLMEGAEGTSGATEAGGEWQKVKRHIRQRGGRKAEAWQQGGGKSPHRRQRRRRCSDAENTWRRRLL